MPKFELSVAQWRALQNVILEVVLCSDPRTGPTTHAEVYIDIETQTEVNVGELLAHIANPQNFVP